MFATLQPFVRQTLVGSCCLLIALFSPPTGSLSAEDAPTEAERDEAKLILVGVIAERNKIRSGVVKSSGMRLRRGGGLPDLKDDEVEGLFAFDFDRDWIRYDNTELQYVRHITASNAPKKLDRGSLNKIPVNAFRRRFCYVRNDEYSTWWSQSGPTIGNNIRLVKPDTELDSSLARYHHFCDLRAAGLMDYRFFQKYMPVETICESLPKKVPLADFKRNGDVVTLTFQNEVRIVVEIDTNDGFRPLSYVITPLGGTPYRSENKAVWERRRGVDVPVRMTMRWEFPDQQKFSVKYDLTLDWQSVNEPVDSKLFDYRLLPDIPADLAIAVIDARGEGPVFLGEWAGTGKELVPSSLVPHQLLRAPRP